MGGAQAGLDRYSCVPKEPKERSAKRRFTTRIGSPVHTGRGYGNIIRRNEQEFEKHPEYYALLPDGHRDNCRKLGTATDRVIHLANQVARGLRAKYPEAWVGLYAYSSHRLPPTIDVQANVYVQVALVNESFQQCFGPVALLSLGGHNTCCPLVITRRSAKGHAGHLAPIRQ